ncbi:MAG: 2-C-methyl-D-erythritol 2,4-cyclodiphosphate synthase [Elusimicrobiota bacterium]
MRIGSGFDLHRIAKASRGWITLGGVKIAAPFKVVAHSDGDLLLHALSDAIRAALGSGDIGEKFPPGIVKTKGMDSRLILKDALALLRRKKCRLQSVSCTLALERPKIAPHSVAIRSALADLLGLSVDRVGLTCKTFESLEPLASRCVACWCVCLIKSS